LLRLNRSGIEFLGSIGLEWSTIGLGLAGLLIASPTARAGARRVAVSALAGGMRLVQGISDFGGQMRQEMTSAMNHNGEARMEMQEPPALPEAPAAH
jgi:hypothetical protein